MCGIAVDEKKEKELVELGVKDSKQLLPKKRKELYDQILKIIHNHQIIIVKPKEIDAALNHPSMNLNKLEALKSAEIINHLNPDKIVLDCPSPTTSSYKFEVQRFISSNIRTILVAQHKADMNNVVVAAASVIAKVTRDNLIEELKAKHGVDFGSGYASDPKTTIFLEENWDKEEFQDLFRKTWESWKRIENMHSQSTLLRY